MSEIALAVPMYNRIDKLKNLLESVNPDIISQVHIADNGNESEEKKTVYTNNYNFELNVIDLEHNAGVSSCRHELKENIDTEYLLAVDSDMVLPDNVGD